MLCWKCGAQLKDPDWGKISFREECPTCRTPLHCCKNCVYYQPGLPNDCKVPGTEFVRDRTAMNLCEDFKILGTGPSKSVNAEDIAKRLFKDE